MTLSPRHHQLLIGFILIAMMVATRGHHLPSVTAMLPSASWAVFFLAGIYVSPLWFAGALMTLAACLDYIAITFGGISSFCVSAAYIALIPAYGTLWSAGRWYRNRTALKAIAPLSLIASVLVGTVICEVISSGGFYAFSGRFQNPSLAEFVPSFMHYLPLSLKSIAIWVALATAIHGVILVARGDAIFKKSTRH